MIIDTDVLIWFLRENEKAKKVIYQNIPFSISVITYMELILGMKNKNELLVLQKYFKKWTVKILQINENISVRAMILMEHYFLSHSLETGDSLIASTSLETNEILLTANDKHYKFIPNIQLRVFRPQ
ncbi:type II toxin-antitoxin system VapC family toxin [Treponema primitia]|uniref:type II toxin-antitoxin system VapC family toxin n=1 Tax=Treponema primitia TaxID=88058 RepID=UPI0039802F49